MSIEKTGSMESPEHLRMSLAAAMTLGFKQGLFYRGAKLHCINLLLTYEDGCIARCAYCGLNGKREGAYREKSFIRVSWPTYRIDDIIARIGDRRDRVKRICISMVTRRRAVAHTSEICAMLRQSFDIPVSLLIAPTVLGHEDLVSFRKAGADKIGVAVDLATEPLFDRFRGKGVGGPHRWDRYWSCLEDAVSLFGPGNAGPHFMVGMGETERDMCRAVQRARDIGGFSHLFSFFPEAGSAMENHPQPPMDQYRRVQVARYLIDNGLSRADRMNWDADGRIMDYGLPDGEIDRVVGSGEPFRTSGCTGYDGRVACNRPFANSRPGPDMRNYPFPPTVEDIDRIRRQMRPAHPPAGDPASACSTGKNV